MNGKGFCCASLATLRFIKSLPKRDSGESFVYSLSFFPLVWTYYIYKNSVILHILLGKPAFSLTFHWLFHCHKLFPIAINNIF